MAKLKAPEGVCSFSHDGEEYEVKKGMIEVPDQALAIALVHGFTIPKGKKAEDDEAAAAEAQAKADAEAAAAAGNPDAPKE